MNHYLIVYRSVTQAQLAGRILNGAGIVYQIQRTPAGLTERGCSYSVRVPERYIRRALDRLQPPPCRSRPQSGGRWRRPCGP